MNKFEDLSTDRLDRGLDAAYAANREFDVWQRVKKAAAEFEETSPEGLSPDEAYLSFLGRASLADKLIGRGSGAVMTEQGLQLDEAARWQIMFALSDGPRSPSEVTRL